MATNKNFVVKNGLEVNTQLLFADATNNKVGIASTQPNVELDVRGGFAATHSNVSGVSTIGQALRVGSGIAGTVFTVLDAGNAVGVGTSQPAYLLDVRSPTGTGTTALYVQGDVRITGDINLDDISVDYAEITHAVVSAASTFNGNLDINADVDVNRSVSITGGATVTGLSTFSSNVDVNADVDIDRSLSVTGGTTIIGLSTFSSNVDVNADIDVNRSLSVTGGSTISGLSTFSSNVDVNADVDINRSLSINAGLAVTGISTFSSNVDINADVDVDRSLAVTGGVTITGLSTFSSNVDVNADVDVSNSVSITGGLGVTGIGTIGTVKIAPDGTGGIITATTGIVTYYGDGQYLQNIVSGVGIATTNPSTGYSEIVGLGATIITFAGPGVSTNATYNGGTGVSVNAASGIATVYLAGGGGLGGYETTITRDSTTVGSGGQSVFTSSNGYSSGYINVYVNGSKLNSSDFAETDSAAGTITLVSAALEGDIVELENFVVTAITGEFETLITKEEYTVTTASQTVFDLGATYRTGYIDVYLNGVRLSSSDFTETDSDTVTLSTAATYGDIVEFVNYESRSISELQPVWRNDGASGGIYTFTTVGVGTSTTTAFLDVYGGMTVRAGVVTIADSASSDIVRITDGGVNIVSGITTVAGSLDVNGTDHDINGAIALDHVTVSGIVTATTSVNVGTSATVDANGARIVGIVTASGFVDDGTDLLTEINTKASTGKAIAMAMVFG